MKTRIIKRTKNKKNRKNHFKNRDGQKERINEILKNGTREENGK